MTTTLLRPADQRSDATPRRHLAVPLAAALAVLVRLPMLGRPPGPDEAGFLMVGQQWHGAGSSLYGDYWVDRPPLLITIFRVAAELGGVVPLRLIGCLATAGIVLGSAHVARRIAGDRAATWAAIAAAALSVNPLLGTARVDGELLSAPFVVAGIAAALGGLHASTRRRIAGAAALSGASMMVALLIKQNIADVGVFAVVAWLMAWRRGRMSGRQVARLAAGFLGGAVACLAVVTAWTELRGTSPAAVFDALYPFRIAAGHVLASSHGSQAPIRFWGLLGAWLVSGMAVVMAATAQGTATRQLRRTAELALAATLAFGTVSVLMGGNYWNHYLVELIVPIAILAGVLVARGKEWITKAVVVATAVTVVGWCVALPFGRTSGSAAIGTAVAAASRPGDSIVTLYGHAETTRASGLASPYPYLWSLPIKTLDPNLHVLDSVLRGPQAPTWIVVAGHLESWGLTTAETSRLVTDEYHPVAHPFGATVYLHDGVDRPVPHLQGVPS